jgi:hypothetical protein
MPRNNDPFAPWNDPLRKHDPFAPHNDPLDKDNPFKPWNDPFGRREHLTEKEKRYYDYGY